MLAMMVMMTSIYRERMWEKKIVSVTMWALFCQQRIKQGQGIQGVRETRKRRRWSEICPREKKGGKRGREPFSAKMELQEYITGQVTDSSCTEALKKYLPMFSYGICTNARKTLKDSKGVCILLERSLKTAATMVGDQREVSKFTWLLQCSGTKTDLKDRRE